jgi:hypothetical protein
MLSMQCMVPPFAASALYGTHEPAVRRRESNVAEPDRTEQLGLPDLGVAPADDDDLESQSGLGKGLSAIIPQLAGLDSDPGSPSASGGLASLIPGVSPAPADGTEEESDAAALLEAGAVRQLRDDLVRALLDGLVNTMRLDLCAYVHRERGVDPQLFLRTPTLATLGPDRAWALFGVLRDAIGGERAGETLAVAGLGGVLLATDGARSTGVFALARAEGLSPQEQAVAGRFCSSFGRAVHQLVADRLSGTGAEDDTVSVEIHEARDSILARVTVDLDGRGHAGSGRADTRVEAVTRAVIDAHPSDALFRYASEVSHEGEHAAVVLMESSAGAVALGSAVTHDGGSRATAHAALRAIAGLAS